MPAMRIDLQLAGAGVVSRNLRAVAGDFREVAAAQREAANASRSLSRAVTGRTRSTQNPTQAITRPLVPVSQAITAQPLTTNITGTAGGPTVVNAQAAASAAALAQANAQAVTSVQILATAAHQAAAALGTVQRAPVRGAGGGAGSGGGPRAARQPSGPSIRLAQAQARLQQAQASGNQQQIFDARFNLAQAQRAMQRAQRIVNPPPPPGFGQRLLELIGTTRVNLGGRGVSASPLINRMGRLFPGTGPAANGAGGAMAGAALTVGLLGVAAALKVGEFAVKGFVTSVKTAADSLAAFSSAQRQSGGTGEQVAALRARGLASGEIAPLAAQLRQALVGDDQARLLGARMGLTARPGIHGSVNQAADLQRFIDALDRMSPTEQTRTARAFGVPEVLSLLGQSQNVRAGQRRDQTTIGNVMDPKTAAAAKEFNAQLGRVRTNFELLVAAAGKTILPKVSKFFELLADGMGKLANIINANPGILDPLLNTIKGFILGAGKLHFASMHGAINLNQGTPEVHKNAFRKQLIEQEKAFETGVAAIFNTKAVDPAQRAAQSTANAINGLTQALEGLHGGAERARNAIRSGQRGAFLERALEQRALQMGAFSF